MGGRRRPEWRFTIGGQQHENAGLRGWYRTWFEPQAVIDEAAALPPVAGDSEALLLRAAARSNLVHAFVHLGHFEQGIQAFDESTHLWERAGHRRSMIGTEITAVTSAAVALGADLRDGYAAAEVAELSGSNQQALFGLTEAVLLSTPQDRRRAVAQAARDHCDGRYPGDESAYLAILGFYALDDDPERAASLVASVIPRTPGTPVLRRLVLLHAGDEPLDLLHDQEHHLGDLVASGAATELSASRFTDNRRKLDAEVARILD